MKTPKNILKNKKNIETASSASYLAEDNNYTNFSAQLARLGLELRDITGDGNCCFRALSDQMHGTEEHHIEYRKRVCQYMKQSREEFEPFVAALIDEEELSSESSSGNRIGNFENGVKNKFMTKKPDAYEKYIKNLEQLGTYGDNGCLVAFARLYQVKINIHQLNMPIWEISGVTRINDLPRELHLSYHNGEHYSSVRTIGDRTRAPANISITKNGQNNFDSYTSKNGNTQTKKNQKNLTENPDNYGYAYAFPIEDDDLSNTFSEYNFNKKVEEIIEITKCMDINMIQEKLVDYNYDTEQTINYLIGQASLADDDNNQSKNRPKKSINAHKNRKMEKKARQMERQKLNYQLKANEQHDDKIQSKRTSSLNNGQQNQQHMFEQAENLSISTISNTQTKLI